MLQELAALREKQAVIQTSGYLEQTDYQAQLDSHLEEAIDELREKSEKEIEDYKATVESVYRDKVSKAKPWNVVIKLYKPMLGFYTEGVAQGSPPPEDFPTSNSEVH